MKQYIKFKIEAIDELMAKSSNESERLAYMNISNQLREDLIKAEKEEESISEFFEDLEGTR